MKINSKWTWLSMDGSGIWYLSNHRPQAFTKQKVWNLSAIEPCEFLMVDVTNFDNSWMISDKPWNEQLYRIIDGEPVFHPNIELKVDDKVLVFHKSLNEWLPRHLHLMDVDGSIYCFADGRTSWTTGGVPISKWETWKLP